MKYRTNSKALLMEIMIAVLFFSLCSTVLLNGFVTARDGSSRNYDAMNAMIQGRNLAEQLNVSAEPVATLTQNGFQQVDETLWKLENDAASWVEVRLEQQNMTAGILYEAEITILRLSGEAPECLITLRSAHYAPGEVE